jgi:hypothetical protein
MQSVLPWVYFPSKVFPSESLLILLFRSTSPRLGCPRSHASRLARSNEPSLQKSLLLAHSQPLKSRLDSEPVAEATNTMSNRLSGGPGRCSLADSALFSARGLPTALVDACASFLLGVFDVKDQSEDESPRSNTSGQPMNLWLRTIGVVSTASRTYGVSLIPSGPRGEET